MREDRGKYPEAVRAAAQAGHELAGMSYGFEAVRSLSTQRENSVIRRSIQTLENEELMRRLFIRK